MVSLRIVCAVLSTLLSVVTPIPMSMRLLCVERKELLLVFNTCIHACCSLIDTAPQHSFQSREICEFSQVDRNSSLCMALTSLSKFVYYLTVLIPHSRRYLADISQWLNPIHWSSPYMSLMLKVIKAIHLRPIFGVTPPILLDDFDNTISLIQLIIVIFLSGSLKLKPMPVKRFDCNWHQYEYNWHWSDYVRQQFSNSMLFACYRTIWQCSLRDIDYIFKVPLGLQFEKEKGITKGRSAQR